MWSVRDFKIIMIKMPKNLMDKVLCTYEAMRNFGRDMETVFCGFVFFILKNQMEMLKIKNIISEIKIL